MKTAKVTYDFDADKTLNLQTRKEANKIYFEWGVFRSIPAVYDPSDGSLVAEAREELLQEFEVPSITGVSVRVTQENTKQTRLFFASAARGKYQAGPFEYYGRELHITAHGIPLDHFLRFTVYMGD